MATVTSLYAIVFVTPIFMSMDVLPAYTSVYHVCAFCLQRPPQGLGSPETNDSKPYEMGVEDQT